MEPSSTIIMLIMVIKAVRLEEQLPYMKFTLDILLKERKEKDAHIKHQNKQIADLIKKLGKRPLEASNKCSGG